MTVKYICALTDIFYNRFRLFQFLFDVNALLFHELRSIFHLFIFLFSSMKEVIAHSGRIFTKTEQFQLFQTHCTTYSLFGGGGWGRGWEGVFKQTMCVKFHPCLGPPQTNRVWIGLLREIMFINKRIFLSLIAFCFFVFLLVLCL